VPYDESLIVVFELLQASACCVRGHRLTEGPLINGGVSIRQVLFEKGRSARSIDMLVWHTITCGKVDLHELKIFRHD
jgi:hypothetical protein